MIRKCSKPAFRAVYTKREHFSSDIAQVWCPPLKFYVTEILQIECKYKSPEGRDSIWNGIPYLSTATQKNSEMLLQLESLKRERKREGGMMWEGRDERRKGEKGRKEKREGGRMGERGKE